MKKRSRYVGKRIDSFTFSKHEVTNILEDVGRLRGRTPSPKIIFNKDRSITLEYIYTLEEEDCGN